MIMDKNSKFIRLKQGFGVGVLLFLLCQTLVCWSLNEEGLVLLRLKDRVVNDPFCSLSNWKEEDEEFDHCSWFGVECSDGKVVVLNLKDLCLEGTLAPELGSLAHIKSIILRNNSFTGIIPQGIGGLEELEVLDLGYNNFSGPIPPELENNLSLTILLLDNNELLNGLSPEIYQLQKLSETQVDENQLSKAAKLSCKQINTWNVGQSEDAMRRRLLQARPRSIKLSPPGAIGGVVFLLILIAIAYLFKTSKVSTVKPWSTGISGQLQKAFVTGVPKLKRSELEAACEDFSNVISSSTVGTVYKGTLSSGIEISVAYFPVKFAKDWSKNLEAQFRNKIETLSKVNHKNFVNLVGYCEEDEPFTRMMVFEYAPNGTLFEHLHIKESEHLDWTTRLRIMVGIASCLEHMHQLNPPIPHTNLSSAAVNLTEDYAAKVYDPFSWNEITAAESETDRKNHSDTPSLSRLESNVYSFGVLLFEILTGRMPYLVDDNGSLDNWASDYLRRDQPLMQMVDPTLSSFDADQVEKIGEVIKSCVHPEPQQRPDMREVGARLREITAITPEGAIPKVSPLWWAELEIMSTEAS
ncbi:hypothetical protein Golob_006466 [Gossypium lobatum]|uniref:Protein kinase domain-containing protein n=1 Tax=Gossypium lobatum TaxID=34289 RepID=A0A7J8MWC3_9ROSI|nr:hypothetical protein [Gossypium lobatum]